MSPHPRPGVAFPRLLIGFVVLVCAEVFSGASLPMGLWHPWTLVVTYWLYFAHFFFFTTLAVATGRTSLGALYLWGLLFGLYESWITKVIWYGYSGDGHLAMGRIGPYGVSELTMVLTFHPVMSFLLPLAVACVLCPPLRRWFPDLAWITGPGRPARALRTFLVLTFAPVVGMNCGGPLNLVLNALFLLAAGLALARLARPGLAAPDGLSIVAFGRPGFVALVAYLVLLHGVTYAHLRPEGLPSARVQGYTLAFYAFAIVGLVLQRRREPWHGPLGVDPQEQRRCLLVLAGVLGGGLVLSFVGRTPFVFIPVVIDFVAWVGLGALLPLLAFGQGIAERLRPGAPMVLEPAGALRD